MSSIDNEKSPKCNGLWYIETVCFFPLIMASTSKKKYQILLI